mmetsp:Transcript_37978/g.60156  ORF Transcript_37978/g.60156 Transcript_37978/m.60156 type:complete len:151 (-) Transcript_37978:121-573(-)
MGAALPNTSCAPEGKCKCQCSDDGKETKEMIVSSRRADDTVKTVQQQQAVSEKKIQTPFKQANILLGVWLIQSKETTRKHEVEIRMANSGSMKVYWDRCYEYPPSPISSLTEDQVEMELAGVNYQATIKSQNSPAEMVWTDGEVWVKSLA